MAPDVASSQRWRRLVYRFLQLFRLKDAPKGELDQSSCDSIATGLDDVPGHRIPEYDAAIRSCSVTLQQIAEARLKVHQGDDQEKMNSLIYYEKLLWQAYQQARGKIKQYYFSMDQRAAVVLIDPPGRKTMDIDLYYPIDELSKLSPKIETCLWTCVSQFQTIAELDLKFKGKDAVFFELYLIVIYLFVVIESQQALHQNQTKAQRPSDTGWERSPRFPRDILILLQGSAKAIDDQTGEPIGVALNYANIRLSELAERVRQFAKREAQVVYIRWMLPGSVCVVALVAIYIYVAWLLRFTVGRNLTFVSYLSTYRSSFLIPIAVTCGALGATVSVLLRVANQPLSVDYHAGRQLIRTAGFVRPIVGAVFGLVFYIIINAGLLQVLQTPSGASRAHYIAAICFAAGFSERRAQDAIVRALPGATEAPADKPLARRPEEDKAS